MVIFIAG